MRRQRLAAGGPRLTLRVSVALALLLAVLLAGCRFQPGAAQFAYLRGDQLWVANPDGSGARQLAAPGVVSFAWSPDHHEVVFRAGGSQPLTTPPPAGATWGSAEDVSELFVTSISGGSATQITPTAPHSARSDAWWDPQGNRLLYREYVPGAGAVSPIYIESQNDQPVGIARKVILSAASLPTLSPDGSRVAVIDPFGAVRVGQAEQNGALYAGGALLRLTSGGRPARLLWRPGSDAVVYPSARQSGATTLNLLDLATRKSQPITSVSGLRDAAFSPDGSLLLLDTETGLLIWPIAGHAPRAVIPETDTLAQSYWSPDGRWLLVEDSAGARLIRTSDWSVAGTLAYAMRLTEPQVSSDTTLWRPAANSPWSADSSAFVFASGAATWNGKPLPTPQGGATGLYTQQVASHATLTLIGSGPISAPAWSYADPSTTLLMAAG